MVSTLDGQLAWISDPVDGAHHDVYCLDEAGVLNTLDPSNWTGDKVSAHRDMLEWEHKFNSGINSVRAVIERVISHLKNWRILHTDYRRPLDTFPTTISAAIALHFYTLA